MTHTKWSYRSIWIRLLSKCAPEVIARLSGNLTNLIMGVFYTVRNIVFFAISAVGIPAMTNETDKHTLHRLYFLGIRKKTLTQPRKDLKEVKTKT